jgi:hypothetical protein
VEQLDRRVVDHLGPRAGRPRRDRRVPREHPGAGERHARVRDERADAQFEVPGQPRVVGVEERHHVALRHRDAAVARRRRASVLLLAHRARA